MPFVQPVEAAAASKVLLVGWDAAEWSILRPLLDAGMMPHLHRLMNAGVHGLLHSPYPLISPMLWTSAVTGKRPMKHGVAGALEPRPDRSATQPVMRPSRTAKAVWEIVSEAGYPTQAINFPATHPVEVAAGARISNLFAISDDPTTIAQAVHPPHLIDGLMPLRVEPADLDAATLLTFVPRAAEVAAAQRSPITMIARILAHTATVHAAATHCLEHVPWRFAAVCYTGLHQFSHGFMEYHLAKRSGTTEHAVNRYQDVITAAYRFHDLMLGRLMELAGGDTTIMLISDHGFHTRNSAITRGIASAESMLASHRQQGIIVMSGRQISSHGGTISGARLLDVAPTVLALLDLPATDDMDGHALIDAIVDPYRGEPASTLPTAVASPPPAAMDPAKADDAIRHLLELGYVEQPDRHAEVAIRQIQRDRDAAMAMAWLDVGEPCKAIALLSPLLAEQPDVLIYRITLAQAYAAARDTVACRKLVDSIADNVQMTPALCVARGLLEFAARRAASAIEYFQQAETLGERSVDLDVWLGQAYLRVSRWEAARRVLRRAIDIDPDHAQGIEDLATAELGTGNASAAAEHARRAIALRPERARPHYLLGVSLLRQGQTAHGISMLRRAAELDPHSPATHRRLAEALAATGHLKQSRAHEVMAQQALLDQRWKRTAARRAPGADTAR